MSELPEKLQPYEMLGLDMSFGQGDDEALADCPWCGRENKFAINIKTGVWRCYVCNEGADNGKAFKGGNVYVFIRMLLDASFKATEPGDYAKLAKDRKLLYSTTLVSWGWAKSIINGNWLFPGTDADGKLMNLYQYVRTKDRMVLMPTKGLGHQLMGRSLYNPECPTVFLCEGPADAMCLWEILSVTKYGTEEEYVRTANRNSSLLNTCSVLAVPACAVFFESWLPLFKDKVVNILFDNDHERTHEKTGATIPPGGFLGLKTAAKIMASSGEYRPESIHYLHWGEDGFDMSLASGYDVRDFLTASE